MTPNKHDLTSLSFDEVLHAISPRRNLNTLGIRDVVKTISETRPSSEPCTDEAIRVKIASSVNAEIHQILGDFFAPNRRRKGRVNRRNVIFHNGQRPKQAN